MGVLDEDTRFWIWVFVVLGVPGSLVCYWISPDLAFAAIDGQAPAEWRLTLLAELLLILLLLVSIAYGAIHQWSRRKMELLVGAVLGSWAYWFLLAVGRIDGW